MHFGSEDDTCAANSFPSTSRGEEVILPNPNSNDIPYYQMQPLHPFDDS